MCPETSAARQQNEVLGRFSNTTARAHGALKLLTMLVRFWDRHARKLAIRKSGEPVEIQLTQLLNQPYAGTLAPFTFARMNFTISSMAVPGWKQRPRRVSSAHRYPDRNDSAHQHQDIVHLFRLSRSMTRGTIALCAPESIESPMTCTSSCSAALTIIPGSAAIRCKSLPCRHRARHAHYLGAAIVTVEAGLRHQDANLEISPRLFI